MARGMKVLLVHNTYQQPGGEDIVVQQERELLERHGHSVSVYLRSNSEIGDPSLSSRIGLVSRMVSSSETKTAVRRIIRSARPDIVHVHNTFALVSPSVYEVCNEEDVPIVQTLHNYRLLCPAATLFREGKVCEECVTHGLLRSVRHACYRNSRTMSGAIALMLRTHRQRQTWTSRIDAYIALSDFVRNKFLNSGIPGHKIFVKPNFVEPDPGERTHPGEYALFVGRLSPEKGIETLLKAWRHLQFPIPLVIAGDGPLRHMVEAEVARSRGANIRFLGQLSREQVYDALKQAAFLVVPSIWHEPFGLIVAESFACGTPVLAASAGALQDMVEHRVTGLQFAPGDPDALAKAVVWASMHPTELAAMGKAARRTYLERYTGSSNYQVLMSIYAAAIESHFRNKRKRPLRTA
jgi:glycosyltransferase involved in cell wall biosynthesis